MDDYFLRPVGAKGEKVAYTVRHFVAPLLAEGRLCEKTCTEPVWIQALPPISHVHESCTFENGFWIQPECPPRGRALFSGLNWTWHDIYFMTTAKPCGTSPDGTGMERGVKVSVRVPSVLLTLRTCRKFPEVPVSFRPST